MQMLVRLGLVCLLALGSACALEPASVCELSTENEAFLTEALAAWDTVSRESLRLDDAELPWMVLFDASCVWHLGGERSRLEGAEEMKSTFSSTGAPVSLHAQPHDGEILLPNHSTIPAQGMAFASLYDLGLRDSGLQDSDLNAPGTRPFFVLALLDVWREDPQMSKVEGFDNILLGVFSHEIVHTLQIRTVGERVAEIKTRFPLPDHVNDDLIEETFQEVGGYEEAYRRESDLFYAAVEEQDPEKRKAIILQALDLADQRWETYFTGENEGYRGLDDLFLNMEGVAVWAAYTVAKGDGQEREDGSVLGFERERNSWSQDQGFALLLLIDDLVPDWRDRLLGEEMAAPFDLLREAVEDELVPSPLLSPLS